MAEKKSEFVGFDIPKLREQYPSGFKRSTTPSVSVNGNGRIVFSSEASKVFAGAAVVVPSFDAGGNRLRFDGFENDKGREGKTLDIVMPKGKDGKQPKSKSVSISAAVVLKAISYDYKKAGNQTFPVDKMLPEKKVLVFVVPKETPVAKPKQPRKPKVKKDATVNTAANGAPAPATPAKQDGEIDIDAL